MTAEHERADALARNNEVPYLPVVSVPSRAWPRALVRPGPRPDAAVVPNHALTEESRERRRRGQRRRLPSPGTARGPDGGAMRRVEWVGWDNGLEDIAESQVDELAGERERLASAIAELDRKIRFTATHAINGMIDEGDAKGIRAPMVGQRETARLQLAALPAKQDLPEPEVIDADELRAAVREAWTSQSLDERRQALSRVLEKVELSPDGLEIICRADGYHGHDPFGPPWGSWGQWEVEAVDRRIRQPRSRTTKGRAPP